MTPIESTGALFDAELKTLYAQFAQSLPERMQHITQTWQQFAQTPDDWFACESLQRLTHTLAGSGATFGFESVGLAARTLDDSLKLLLAMRASPTSEQCAHIHQQLAALSQVAQIARLQTSHTQPAERASTTEKPRVIFACDDDNAVLQDLQSQLAYFGYVVRVFSALDDLQTALLHETPLALIISLNLLEHTADTLQPHAIPIIFIALRDDLEARLRAVRMQGKAYLTKPIDVGLLADKLDALTSKRQPEPYRILVVDDSRVTTEICRVILERVGMSVVALNDPLAVMSPLIAFKPDLVLMDLNMPGSNGEELAEVIRQQEAFVSIPIIYLSGESDLDKQLSVMSLGADGFLTKPIKPAQLLAAVTSRGQRSRAVRSLISRDSLTGLLNHTALKEQLASELVRAERQHTSLAFAMLDLDHFKHLNDAHGHASGDRALKSLAQLLQQRLRRSDIIGRYGGEEFAIIFPNTDAVMAVQVLDSLRASFAQLRQKIQSSEFHVTFSAGVAGFPEFAEAATLSDAADRALRAAKHEGRNRIVLSFPDEAATQL